jgi:hypothetical protein
MQGPARAGGVGVDLETGLVWPGGACMGADQRARGFGGRRATSCLIGLLSRICWRDEIHRVVVCMRREWNWNVFWFLIFSLTREGFVVGWGDRPRCG